MNRQQGFSAKLKSRQQGAVAIIVAICIVVLVGMLGLVLDLGHLYVAKTELQNAADAAALSGAKELDGTSDGVIAAKDKAIEAALRNKYDLNATEVTIDDTNLEFSDSPDGGWKDFTEAKDHPAGKTFLKVDTGKGGTDLQSFNTWFVHVLPGTMSTMRTFGMAVAGRYLVQVTPLGVCAVDKLMPEQGFIRGVSYDVVRLNPLTIKADKLWINPVDAPPDTCTDPQFDATAKMAPFVCTGKSLVVRTVPGQVYVNSGKSSSLGKELDSRFNDYQGSSCADPSKEPSAALPDTNIMQYVNRTASTANPKPDAPYVDVDWMSLPPSQQGITIIDDYATTGVQKGKPIAKTTLSGVRTSPSVFTYKDKKGDTQNYPITFKDYGVLWSYPWEYNFSTGQNHVLNDWTNLYLGSATGYPSAPAIPHPSPYKSGVSKYTSTISTGEPERRILNLLIIDCDAGAAQLASGNKCLALDTLAVGEFFMPVKAGNLDSLYLEFNKQVAPPLPIADIRLYR